MIAVSATPLGPFAYVIVFLMLIAFVLGLFAGHLAQPPQRLKDKDYQQVYTAGYHEGYRQAQQDNGEGNNRAFQQGYTNGYNQAVVDLQEPKVTRPATAPMRANQPEATAKKEEPTQHDDRQRQPSSFEQYRRQFLDQVYANLPHAD